MMTARHSADPRQVIFTWLLLALLFGGTGCGLPKQWHDLANSAPEATPTEPASQTPCSWEPGEGVDRKGLRTRGFAGKITFSTRHQATGVRVRGDVQVSVFDAQGPVENRGQPIHNWVFKGDAWA